MSIICFLQTIHTLTKDFCLLVQVFIQNPNNFQFLHVDNIILLDDTVKYMDIKKSNLIEFISAMPLYWSSSCEELDRTPPTLGLQTRAVSTEAVSPCLPRPQHQTAVTVGPLPLVLLPLLHHLLHLLRGLYLLLLSCITTLVTILLTFRVYPLALRLALRYSCLFFFLSVFNNINFLF